MPIVQVFVVLILLGLALWAVSAVGFIAPPIKNVINVLVVVIAVLFVLQAFGLLDGIGAVRVR